MKVCFPVAEARGLDSVIFGHFGSAPFFVMVDTETSEVSELANADAVHEHGGCSPLKALAGAKKVDGVVVGGIGAGALGKLVSGGMQVYKSEGGSIRENLALLSSGQLKQFSPMFVCKGHSGGGCSHH